MRSVAQPRSSPARFDAIPVSLRAWVAGLLVWFCEVLDAVSPALRALPGFEPHLAEIKAAIARDLRRSVHIARLYLVNAAYERATLKVRRARYHPPYVKRTRLSARGFCRAATSGALRGLNQGSLRQRAEAMRRFLDTLDRRVTRVQRQLRAMYQRGPTDRAGVSAALHPRLPNTLPRARRAPRSFDTS